MHAQGDALTRKSKLVYKYQIEQWLKTTKDNVKIPSALFESFTTSMIVPEQPV